ncbi:Hydrophobic surface binding protein A [Microdochium nivale]|nr:Hydrophobic surface binding protein A [Microdochium nivale]
MKFTTVFSAAALAYSAIAEPIPRSARSNTRDIAAVESAASSITASLKALTNSVAQFNGDSIQVEADASALATAIELGTEGIVESGDLDAAGLAGLQACMTPLADAGKDLIQKLTIKKNSFEQAGLCSTIEKAMLEIGTQSKDLIKTVTGLLPEQFQGIAEQVGNTVTLTLMKGVDAYSVSNCVSNPLANTSKSMIAYPTGTLTFSALDPIPTTKTATVQVTVTSCSAAVTQTSISIVSPLLPVTPSYLPTGTPLITAPQPAPTGTAPSTTVVKPSTPSTPALPVTSIPTAAGLRNTVSNAGLVAAVAIVAAMVY